MPILFDKDVKNWSLCSVLAGTGCKSTVNLMNQNRKCLSEMKLYALFPSLPLIATVFWDAGLPLLSLWPTSWV